MLAIVLLICTSFGLTACIEFEKTAIDAYKFATTMESKGYTISNETERDMVFYLPETTCIASKDGCVIEFYIFDSADDAYDFFDDLQFDFDFEISGATTETSGKNYNKFEGSSKDAYKMICRVDNTAMCIEVEKSNEDIAKAIVKEFGY